MMDADGGLGIHIGPMAMELAVQKAKAVGMGCVAVRGAGHLGGAGYHAMVAAEAGCIGQCFGAPGGALVPPTFGAEPRFGTHPIAWAAPAGPDEAPFLFDVATTQVAGNKIRLAARLGVKLAPNWVTEPASAPDAGRVIEEEIHAPHDFMLTPMGGTRENSSHKGYGMQCVVDLLCNSMTGIGAGCLTGGGGLLFTAYRIEAFTPLHEYEKWAAAFLKALRETPPAPGHERVYYPGLHAAELRRERMAHGIEYHPEVLAWLQDIADDLGGDELQAAVAAALPAELSQRLTPEARASWEARTQGGVIGMGSMSHGGGIASKASVGLGKDRAKDRPRGLSTAVRRQPRGRSAAALGVPQRRALSSAAAAHDAHASPRAPRAAAIDGKLEGSGMLAGLLAAQGVAVLDGGLGSLLPDERVAGLWSAGHLETADGCAAIADAHLQFLRAGADIIGTNSYKVSARLLRNTRGLDVEAGEVDDDEGDDASARAAEYQTVEGT